MASPVMRHPRRNGSGVPIFCVPFELPPVRYGVVAIAATCRVRVRRCSKSQFGEAGHDEDDRQDRSGRGGRERRARGRAVSGCGGTVRRRARRALRERAVADRRCGPADAGQRAPGLGRGPGVPASAAQGFGYDTPCAAFKVPADGGTKKIELFMNKSSSFAEGYGRNTFAPTRRRGGRALSKWTSGAPPVCRPRSRSPTPTRDPRSSRAPTPTTAPSTRCRFSSRRSRSLSGCPTAARSRAPRRASCRASGSRGVRQPASSGQPPGLRPMVRAVRLQHQGVARLGADRPGLPGEEVRPGRPRTAAPAALRRHVASVQALPRRRFGGRRLGHRLGGPGRVGVPERVG